MAEGIGYMSGVQCVQHRRQHVTVLKMQQKVEWPGESGAC